MFKTDKERNEWWKRYYEDEKWLEALEAVRWNDYRTTLLKKDGKYYAQFSPHISNSTAPRLVLDEGFSTIKEACWKIALKAQENRNRLEAYGGLYPRIDAMAEQIIVKEEEVGTLYVKMTLESPSYASFHSIEEQKPAQDIEDYLILENVRYTKLDSDKYVLTSDVVEKMIELGLAESGYGRFVESEKLLTILSEKQKKKEREVMGERHTRLEELLEEIYELEEEIERLGYSEEDEVLSHSLRIREEVKAINKILQRRE